MPRSGGKKTGKGNLIDAAKKRAAADCAESMIETWGSKPLTLANYRKLAALLFKLATGKDGDVEQACRARRSAGGEITSQHDHVRAHAGEGKSITPMTIFRRDND